MHLKLKTKQTFILFSCANINLISIFVTYDQQQGEQELTSEGNNGGASSASRVINTPNSVIYICIDCKAGLDATHCFRFHDCRYFNNAMFNAMQFLKTKVISTVESEKLKILVLKLSSGPDWILC